MSRFHSMPWTCCLMAMILAAGAGCDAGRRTEATAVTAPVGEGVVSGTPAASERIRNEEADDRVREPETALRLRDVLELTLSRSPVLSASAIGPLLADADRVQAGLRVNPTVGLEVENVAGTGDLTGAGSAETTLQLGQVIELGGKRQARLATARAGEERAIQESEWKRMEVMADATLAFIHVVADQQRVVVAEEGVALAEEGLAAIRDRIEAGAASPLEEQRARVALARNRIGLEHAEHELRAARRRLAAFWGADEPVFNRAEGELFGQGRVPEFEELAGKVESSPGVARWVTEERLAATELRLARARSVPNLTLGAGVKRFERTDDAALVFGASIPLPVFNRNQGNVTAAELRSGRAAYWREAERVRLRAVLYGMCQEILHAAEELRVLEEEVLPAAREALELAERGFETGRFSQLDLLEAQRTLLELRRERIDAGMTRHMLVLEIERLLGVSLAGAERNQQP